MTTCFCCFYWEAYNYAGQNPVMFVDPTGLFVVNPDSGGPSFGGQYGACFNGAWTGPTPYNPDPSTGGILAEEFSLCTSGIDDGIFGPDGLPDPPDLPGGGDGPGGGPDYSGPTDPPSPACVGSARSVFAACFNQADKTNYAEYDRCAKQALTVFDICDSGEGGLPSRPPLDLLPGWVSIFVPISNNRGNVPSIVKL